MLFNTVLTNDERQGIEGYLSWKWGINSGLPANHSYYANGFMSGGGFNTQLIPKIIYENKKRNKIVSNKNDILPQTFMSGGGIILSPASYALENTATLVTRGGSRNKLNPKIFNNAPQTFMTGGGIVLSPASYALEQ